MPKTLYIKIQVLDAVSDKAAKIALALAKEAVVLDGDRLINIRRAETFEDYMRLFEV